MEFRIQGASKRHFGTWNKAVKKAGLCPNEEWLVKRKIPSKDGHVCDSASEVIIDNWLYARGIEHGRRKRYPKSRCNCDFYLPEYGAWVEYFGLIDEHRNYNKSIRKKRQLAKKHKLNLIEIYPDDIYPDNNLDLIFSLIKKK